MRFYVNKNTLKSNMRIWHEKLIPKLCRQHLLAMWREGLGCYKIITEDKKGYRNHPAVKEFDNCPLELSRRLALVRMEMQSRGYNPKKLPWDESPNGYEISTHSSVTESSYHPWQTLEEQIEVLKKKGCRCQI